MRWIRPVLILSFFLTLCACTAPFQPGKTQFPDTQPPLSALKQSTDIPKLVSDFLSEISETEDPELNHLITEALQNNKPLVQKYLEIEKSFLEYRIDKANLLPSLTASLSPSLSNSMFSGRRKTQENYALAATSNWEIDLWGRLSDKVKSGHIATKISHEDYYYAQISLISQLSQAWFDLIAARKFKNLSDLNYQIKEQSLKKTKRRFYLGRVKGSDVRIAQTSLANAEAAQAQAENRLKKIKRNLEVLIGHYPSARLTGKETLPSLQTLSFNEKIEDFIENRPDVKRAVLLVKQAGININYARKSLYPSLSLQGRLSLSSFKFNDLFDLDQWVGNLTAQLLQPVFNAGALKATHEKTKIQYQQALFNYGQAVLLAAEEIENALEAEIWLKKEETAYQKAFITALSANRQVDQQYNEGLVTIFDLLSFQSQRINSEKNLINAQTERLKNRIKLKTALGGSWQVRQKS